MNPIAPLRSPDGSDPFKVFLSHAFKDAMLVRLFRDQLHALGLDVYLAEHDPGAGGSLANKIQTEIKNADAVIVLLTAGDDSAYVQQEIGIARALEKLIIPLLSHKVDRRRLGMLAEVEWIEFDEDDPTTGMISVTANVQKLLEKRRAELFARREAELLAQQAELLEKQAELIEKHQAEVLDLTAKKRAALEARDRANGLALVSVVLFLIMAFGSGKD